MFFHIYIVIIYIIILNEINSCNSIQHNITLLSYNHGIEEVNCTVSFDNNIIISKLYMP